MVLREWRGGANGRRSEWANGRRKFGFVPSKLMCTGEDEIGVSEAGERFARVEWWVWLALF
jgi:hypothetical protein